MFVERAACSERNHPHKPTKHTTKQNKTTQPKKGDAAHVSCDGGRVCRPLIICDDGAPRVTDAHISKLKAGEWGFQDFLAQGLVEYVDVNEEGSALVAMYPSDCTREVRG
jgi:DNA-directed RNA polymerase beta subunit